MTAYSFMSLTPDSRQLCLLHHGSSSRIITLWPVKSWRVSAEESKKKRARDLELICFAGSEIECRKGLGEMW